jgi:hypothetical protein
MYRTFSRTSRLHLDLKPNDRTRRAVVFAEGLQRERGGFVERPGPDSDGVSEATGVLE